jgi:hypothetical protein
MIFEAASAKGLAVGLLQSGQMKRICIAEEEDTVCFPQLSQQLDAFGWKVEQQCIPAIDDGLVGYRKSREPPDRVDKLLVVEAAYLISSYENPSHQGK